MRRPRTNLATLGILVALLAFDFAWMRLLDPARRPSVFLFPDMGFDLGVIPMANVLAFGLYRILCHRPRPHHFLVGFEIFGLVAVLAYMIWCWTSRGAVVILMEPLFRAWTYYRPLPPPDL